LWTFDWDRQVRETLYTIFATRQLDLFERHFTGRCTALPAASGGAKSALASFDRRDGLIANAGFPFGRILL
jgi:hypothetical protein